MAEKKKKRKKATGNPGDDPLFWERHEFVQRRLLDYIGRHDPALRAELERLAPPMHPR